MPTYTLNVFDINDISTDDPDGFSDNGGYQFSWGVSTVTIAPGSEAIPVPLTDSSDEFFDDDAGVGQVSNDPVSLNGITYPAGTIMEAEYKINLEDSLGNPYVIQFVSMANDAFDIAGFVIQGAVPPFGEPLTVVSTQDVANGQYRYSTSQAPACFASGTRVLTSSGWVAAERLRRGDRLVGPDGTPIRLDMVLRCREQITRPERVPIRIRAGALGGSLPHQNLVLSPHHRVLIAPDALAPARGLTVLRGVGRLRNIGAIEWVHLVTARHGLLLAEGVTCETFWPGPEAMRALPVGLGRAIRRLMGPAPVQVRPFLSVSETRQLVTRHGAPND